MNLRVISAPAHASAASRAVVAETELLRRRMLRALAQRERYRYVQPELHDTAEGWVITSPCCSRNIDPDGGVIDIARLRRDDDGWLLQSRDHHGGCWIAHSQSPRLDALLDILCEDAQRVDRKSVV